MKTDTPSDPHLEREVLGGLLLSPRDAVEVCELCVPADFHDVRLRRLAGAVWRLNDEGGPWDCQDVPPLLGDGEAAWAQARETVSALTDSDPPSGHLLRKRAAKLAAIGQARRVWDAAVAVVESAPQIFDDPEVWIADVAAMQTEALDRVDQTGPEHIDLVDSAHTAMRRRRGGAGGGIPTGFDLYDRASGGMHDGTVIVVGARTRVGKSAMATTIAQHVASVGIPVLVFSFEMTREQLTERMLAGRSGVDLARLTVGAIGDDDEREIENASRGDVPIWVDTTTMGVARLASRLRAWRRRVDAKRCLVIIDYLQLTESAEMARGASREQDVAATSRAVKRLARRERIPIMLLSQLNRRADDRERPRLSDLRESGSIEQDADVVWLLHRPEIEAKNDEERAKVRGLAELIIAKNRQGPTMTIRMHFDGPRARFTEDT